MFCSLAVLGLIQEIPFGNADWDGLPLVWVEAQSWEASQIMPRLKSPRPTYTC